MQRYLQTLAERGLTQKVDGVCGSNEALCKGKDMPKPDTWHASAHSCEPRAA